MSVFTAIWKGQSYSGSWLNFKKYSEVGTLHKKDSKTRKIGIPTWVVQEAKNILEKRNKSVEKEIDRIFNDIKELKESINANQIGSSTDLCT